MIKLVHCILFAIFSSLLNGSLYAIAGNGLTESQSELLLEESVLVKKSTHCGDLYILDKIRSSGEHSYVSAPFYSFSGAQVEKRKRTFPWIEKKPTGIISYQTPKARIFLSDPELINLSKKQIKKYLNKLLESEIREEVRRRFQQESGNIDILGNEKIDRFLSKMSDILFPEDNRHPQRQVRLYMAMYPDIAVDILSQVDHPLRPLFCRYQHKQHNIKIAKRWGHVIVIPALALGAASIIIGSEGIVLAPLAVAAGSSAVLVGLKDIGYGIYNVWHTEKAAYLAKRHKLIQKEMKKVRESLGEVAKQRALTEGEQELISELKKLQKMNTKDRLSHMNKLCRKVHFNRMLIAFGILNAGFNGVNLSGDPTILGSLPGLVADWLGF